MIAKSGAVKDDAKFDYVEFAGVRETMLIEVGKFTKNLPITNFNANPDTPCMDQKEVMSLPTTQYPDAFQANEYQHTTEGSFGDDSFIGGGCSKDLNTELFKDTRFS